MKHIYVSSEGRIEKRSDDHYFSQDQRPASLKLNPRITSVIHVSIKSSQMNRSVLDRKSNEGNNNNTRIRTTDHSEKRLEESIRTTRSVRVTRVQRSSLKRCMISSKLTSHSSGRFDYKNNTETHSTIKHDRFRTGKVADQQIITNQSILSSHAPSKKSLGTVKDLTDSTHRYHRLDKNKKIKNLIEYCCRCSRRRAIMSLCSLLFLGLIIAIVVIVLWKKSQTTSSQISRVALLRWNTTGITLFGTTSIRGNTSNQFYNPFGLILNSLNDFYIADRKNNRIQKCRAGSLTCATIAGQANAVAGTNMSDLNGPTYLYMDTNNGLYIADSGNHRVQFWSYSASYGNTIAGMTGSPGSALNQLNIPYGITLNSDVIYVADCNNNRVMQYTSGLLSGTVVAGGNGPGTNNTQFNCPAGLYFDTSTNSLIIANFAASNIVRWKLGENSWTIVAGDINGVNGNTSVSLDHPTSIIFDPMGNMYVADMFNHRIQIYFVGQSNAITIAGIMGNNSTMLYYPVSMVLDNQLNLYVTDSFNQRIQKFLRY